MLSIGESDFTQHPEFSLDVSRARSSEFNERKFVRDPAVSLQEIDFPNIIKKNFRLAEHILAGEDESKRKYRSWMKDSRALRLIYNDGKHEEPEEEGDNGHRRSKTSQIRRRRGKRRSSYIDVEKLRSLRYRQRVSGLSSYWLLYCLSRLDAQA